MSQWGMTNAAPVCPISGYLYILIYDSKHLSGVVNRMSRGAFYANRSIYIM